MKVRHLFYLIMSVGIVIGAVEAAPRSQEQRSSQLVDQALQLTKSAEKSKRADLLDEAIVADPANKPARWQSGQVQQDGQWIEYQKIPNKLADDNAIQQYRKIRSQTPMTRNGQLELANWCRDHQLPLRERAHLTAALTLSDNPDDPVLRARLGFQQVDGVWTTKSEIAAQKENQQNEQKAVKNWRARLSLLAKKLDARRRSVKDNALKELRQLRNPEIIPVLESVLLHTGLERERLLVKLLSDIPSHKAADALARVGVFSNWDVVLKEAATELHKRPIESYAPELIRSLRTPINSRISLFVGAGGVHLLRSHVSETQYKRQVVQAQSSIFIRPVILGSIDSVAAAERARNKVGRAAANGAIEAELKGYAANRNAKLQSEVIDKWNDRVCAVLREGTGIEQPNDARRWWTWWYDYNQMEEEEKEVETRQYYEQRTEDVAVADPTQTTSPQQEEAPPPLPTSNPGECLVAGTVIWTDRGFVAVEKIQVGDLVLSQSPATGELSYRPVLRTTIRDEKPVLQVTTTGGVIRATGGHTFWVNGTGWKKLRQVKAGETFHTVDGPVEVLELEPSGNAKTYNLIVADDHTYFVGRSRILSHDVTFAEPVDNVIPGLAPQWETAERSSRR